MSDLIQELTPIRRPRQIHRNGVLEGSRALLGRLCVTFGNSWGLLAVFWVVLGGSGLHFKRSWGGISASFGGCGGSFESFFR